MKASGFRRWLIPAALVVGVLAGRWWDTALPAAPAAGTTAPPSPPVADTPVASPPASAANALAEPATPLTDPVTIEPLPEHGTALAPIQATLRRRLDQGDVRAGCRLARELHRCHRYALLGGDRTDAAIEGLAAASTDDARSLDRTLNSLAERSLATDTSRQVCAGLAPGSFEDYFDILLKTAQLGDPASMVEFADGGGFLNLEFVRHPERLVAWKTIAESLIYRAVESGAVTALYPLMLARSGERSFLGALLDDDPVEAQALALLLDRLRPGLGSSLLHQDALDDAGLVAAEDRAAELYRRHFSHVDPDSMPAVMPGLGEPDVAACDQLGAAPQSTAP